MTRFFTAAKILQLTPIKRFIDKTKEFIGKRRFNNTKGKSTHKFILHQLCPTLLCYMKLKGLKLNCCSYLFNLLWALPYSK